MKPPKDPMSRRVLAGIAGFWLLQALTLDSPALSGDEAISPVALLDEVAHAAESGLSLNPVLPYLGPLDAWGFAAPVALFAAVSDGVPPAWLLRSVTLLLALAGSLAAWAELRRRSPLRGAVFGALCAFQPLSAVYSRIAWGPSLLLGLSGFLLAEVLRWERVGRPRPYRLALICGVALECHPTAVWSIVALLGAELRGLWRELRLSPRRSVGAAILGLALAYPVLRNFPPPVGSSGAGTGSVLWELRAWFNIVSGQRPLEFLMGRDVLPVAFRVGIVAGWIALFAGRWRSLLARPAAPAERELRARTLAVAAATCATLVFCYRGRHLDGLGNERYLVPLAVPWTYLAAEAIDRVSASWRGRRLKVAWALAALGLLQAVRMLVPMLAWHPDPRKEAARWLEARCPRASCLGYAENYWNYWPIRYYSRDRIELNVVGHNWKKARVFERGAREAAGCWAVGSSAPYRGPFTGKVEFAGRTDLESQVCYTGIRP